MRECPFCGGEAMTHTVDFPDGDRDWVFDCKCGRKIFNVSSKKDAIEAWNARARESELEEKLTMIADAERMAEKVVSNREKRIRDMESLVQDMWDGYDCFQCKLFGDECKVKPQEQMGTVKPCKMERRISALGIEV